MIGNKQIQPRLFYQVSIEDLVPASSFYRRLKENLNLHWTRNKIASLYGKCGQKSIAPEVFFKLVLVGYLENITSDRKLMELATQHMGIKYFINYDLHEELPWHSTISRTRKLIPSAMFEEIFESVLKQCVEAGMVEGRTQSIDAMYVKANASLDSLEKKVPIKSVRKYIDATRIENEESKEEEIKSKESSAKSTQKSRLKKLGGEPNGRFLSNEDYYSKSDPDARVAKKTGKERDMYHTCSMAVDAESKVITHIRSDFADIKDSRLLQSLTEEVCERMQRLDLEVKNILADGGYGSGENYRELEKRNLNAYIPLHGTYKKEVEGFSYDKGTDTYVCSQGKVLKACTPHFNKGNISYRYFSKISECRDCPLKESCIGKGNQKKITKTIFRDEYERMDKRLESKTGQQMMKLRQSSVEPVFGTLKEYMGLRKIGCKGNPNATKCFLMAATAYNLKKLMKFMTRKRGLGIKEKEKNPLQNLFLNFIFQIQNCC